jgi:hypothetical protein
MLEAGDINDSDIITKTVQRSLPPHGFAQFIYSLPSGRKICSEAIPPDHMKQALRAWTQVVRDSILADADEERKQKIALAREAQALLAAVEKWPKPVGEAGVAGAPPVEAPKRPDAKDVEYREEDPTELARTNLARLTTKIELLKKQAHDVSIELSDALKAQKRWNRIMIASGEEDL